MIISVNTIAKPEKIAPATKYGGKMMVCHPGITEVAKSKDTMVCTESTSSVAKPTSTSETSAKRCESLARPLQPNETILYIFLVKGVIARSLIIAKSGSNPVHQKTSDTER